MRFGKLVFDVHSVPLLEVRYINSGGLQESVSRGGIPNRKRDLVQRRYYLVNIAHNLLHFCFRGYIRWEFARS